MPRGKTKVHAARVQRGAALLVILAIILVAFTVTLTASLSINGIRQKSTQKNITVMAQAKTAIEGYALRQQPMGGLPCPDIDDDGFADVVGVNCSAYLGRLPYKTLSLPELRDGDGSVLWYAVERNLVASSSAAKNSSALHSLVLDSQPMAALVIAANRVVDNQVRGTPINVNAYLEGENASANTEIFEQVVDEDHNDQLLGISYSAFWHLVQRSYVKQLGELLSRYQQACGELPWAASFGGPPYNSVDLQQAGAVPFHSALPVDWNTGCAAGIVPANWWYTHWGPEIYYAMCTSAQANCISIVGDSPQAAAGVLVAPGVPIGSQSRPSTDLTQYFENENADGATPFELLRIMNFSGSFNDVVYPITP